MEFRRKVRKVGNSLVLTLPKKITAEKNITANQEVVIVSTNLGIGIFHEGWVMGNEGATVAGPGDISSEDVSGGRAEAAAGSEVQAGRSVSQTPRGNDSGGPDAGPGRGRVTVPELEEEKF